LTQIQQLRKFFYQKYTNAMMKEANLLNEDTAHVDHDDKNKEKLKKSRLRRVSVSENRFKTELYAMKLESKKLETKIETVLAGLLKLLVHRVTIIF
jgi:hypothetical protein